VVADEREDVINKGVKMIWEEGKDEWAPYAMAHMEAIRYVSTSISMHVAMQCPCVPPRPDLCLARTSERLHTETGNLSTCLCLQIASCE
jgi:hypothetical protein